MAVIRKYQNNFTAGVISASAQARTDLQKYASGCSKILNAVVQAHGGLSKRPGTLFADRLPGPGYLFPFAYSTEQTYVLCFYEEPGEEYAQMRIYMNGAAVLHGGEVVEIETPYKPEELGKIKFTQSADVLFLAHPAHPPMKLTRRQHWLWEFEEIRFYPSIEAPVLTKAQANNKMGDPSGTYSEIEVSYKVSAVGSRREESMPSDPVTVGDGSTEGGNIKVLSTWPSGALVELEWTEVPGADHYEVYKNSRGYYAWLGSSDTNKFTDNNKEGDSGTGPKENRDPFNPPGAPEHLTLTGGTTTTEKVAEVRVSSINSAGTESVACAAGTVTSLKEELSATWDEVEGAGAYHLYMRYTDETDWDFVTVSGWEGAKSVVSLAGLDSLVGQTITAQKASGSETLTVDWDGYVNPVTGYVSLPTGTLSVTGLSALAGADVLARAGDKSTVRKLTVAPDGHVDLPPRVMHTPSDPGLYITGKPLEKPNSYPGAVGIYQQRLVFGRSDLEPQTVWMSETGAFDSMAVANPLRDDSAITATIDSKQMNEIRHFVQLRDMLVLTSGAELALSAGKNADAVTPTSLNFSLQSYWGSSEVPPVVTGMSVLFAENAGLVVRDLQYQLTEDGYTGNDVSVLAKDLIDSPVRDWAYQQDPYHTLWVCLESGKLLTFTYMREQEIWAWSEHYSLGADFLSVCSIRGGTEDDVYFLVKRGGYYYVEVQERWKAREGTTKRDVKDAFFVDCGLRREEPRGVGYLTGLELMAEQAVTVEGEDRTEAREVSLSGSVDLPTWAKRVSGLDALAGATVTLLDWGMGFVKTARVSGDGVVEVTTKVTRLTGLAHLAGKEVAVLADGSAVRGLTVDGFADLPDPEATHLTGLGEIAADEVTAYASDGSVLGVVEVGFDGRVDLPSGTVRVTGLSVPAERGTKITVWKGETEVTEMTADGAVNLPNEAGTVIAGLSYKTEVVTLDPEIRDQSGPVAAGVKKNVVRASLLVQETSSLKVGPSVDKVTEYKFSNPTEWGAPAKPFSGWIEAVLPGDHRNEASVAIVQEDPLPLTVLALVTTVGAG